VESGRLVEISREPCILCDNTLVVRNNYQRALPHIESESKKKGPIVSCTNIVSLSAAGESVQ
jgi:hypothetical protein